MDSSATMKKISLRILDEKSLEAFGHQLQWKTCVKCEYGSYAHNKVFARGEVPCEILFIGEAPGKTEDLTGVPFMGKAGRVFDWILQKAQDELSPPREQRRETNQMTSRAVEPALRFAITNVVICRPTDRPGGPNRPPTLAEIGNCRERLNEFILMVAKPKVIICLGRIAAGALPEWEGLPIRHLVHPAYINYSGGLKTDKGRMLANREAIKLAGFIREVRRGVKV